MKTNQTNETRGERAIRDAVASACILASAQGRVTKGFASLDTKTLVAIADTTPARLFQALRRMEALSLVILGALDKEAVDVALTAHGLGAYLAGDTRAGNGSNGSNAAVTRVIDNTPIPTGRGIHGSVLE